MTLIGESEEHEFHRSGRFAPPAVYDDIEDWESCWQPVVVAEYPHPIRACYFARNHPIHIVIPPDDPRGY